jgi:hypothetical protein
MLGLIELQTQSGYVQMTTATMTSTWFTDKQHVPLFAPSFSSIPPHLLSEADM